MGYFSRVLECWQIKQDGSEDPSLPQTAKGLGACLLESPVPSSSGRNREDMIQSILEGGIPRSAPPHPETRFLRLPPILCARTAQVRIRDLDRGLEPDSTTPCAVCSQKHQVTSKLHIRYSFLCLVANDKTAFLGRFEIWFLQRPFRYRATSHLGRSGQSDFGRFSHTHRCEHPDYNPLFDSTTSQ